MSISNICRQNWDGSHESKYIISLFCDSIYTDICIKFNFWNVFDFDFKYEIMLTSSLSKWSSVSGDQKILLACPTCTAESKSDDLILAPLHCHYASNTNSNSAVHYKWQKKALRIKSLFEILNWADWYFVISLVEMSWSVSSNHWVNGRRSEFWGSSQAASSHYQLSVY